MTDPVNLNRFRKNKARAEKAARADENAVKHGRTKAEKKLEQKQAELADKNLTGHKIRE